MKLLPPDAAKKPFTLAVALGSPPDDFRNEKGEVAGWEIDIMHAATQALGLELRGPAHHVRHTDPRACRPTVSTPPPARWA